MTAQERLRPIITMTSPDGNVFKALYQGSPRSKSKKLGIFSYPQFKGEIVQDLDINSSRYPMTIYFQGPDHDKEADLFYKSFDERGQWEVIHPVHGVLPLQPISINENNLPVENSSFTSFDLEWIEPANITVFLTPEEAIAAVEAQAKKTNLSLLDQLSKLKQDTFAKIQAAKAAIDAVTNVIDSVIGPIAATVTELNDAFNQIQGSIQNLLDSAILDPLQLLGQITNLVQLPALALNDFQARFESYKEAAESIFGFNPDTATDENFNVTLINELTLGAILVASAQIGASSDFTTRSQVIDGADQSAQLLLDITNNLDVQQALYDSVDIDNQYFSQSSAYNDILYLSALSQRALLLSLFDLSIEKRFILKKQRSTLEITATEYGALGNADSDFLWDLLISSNNLQGNDILILPAGREVVIYG